MKLYLAGPMSGHPDHNFPAFHKAAKSLREQGFIVISPAETDGGDLSKPRSYYLRKDLADLLSCDCIVALPGWRESEGASLEMTIAHQCDIRCVEFQDNALLPLPWNIGKNTVLTEAAQAVHERSAAYGPPLESYTRTSALWSAVLGFPVTPKQALLCMIALKISRECHLSKRDNLVDIAGYAECLDGLDGDNK